MAGLHLFEVPRRVKFIETERTRMVSRGQREERTASCLIDGGFPLREIEEFWGHMVDIVTQKYEYTSCLV